MNISLAELLRIRSEWEELVSKFKFPEESFREGTINNIKWFKEFGHTSNRLRKNYKAAMQLSEEFLNKL